MENNEKNDKRIKKDRLNNAIVFSNKKGGLKSLVGIWKDTNITLEKIREKAWKMN